MLYIHLSLSLYLLSFSLSLYVTLFFFFSVSLTFNVSLSLWFYLIFLILSVYLYFFIFFLYISLPLSVYHNMISLSTAPVWQTLQFAKSQSHHYMGQKFWRLTVPPTPPPPFCKEQVTYYMGLSRSLFTLRLGVQLTFKAGGVLNWLLLTKYLCYSHLPAL